MSEWQTKSVLTLTPEFCEKWLEEHKNYFESLRGQSASKQHDSNDISAIFEFLLFGTLLDRDYAVEPKNARNDYRIISATWTPEIRSMKLWCFRYIDLMTSDLLDPKSPYIYEGIPTLQPRGATAVQRAKSRSRLRARRAKQGRRRRPRRPTWPTRLRTP